MASRNLDWYSKERARRLEPSIYGKGLLVYAYKALRSGPILLISCEAEAQYRSFQWYCLYSINQYKIQWQ